MSIKSSECFTIKITEITLFAPNCFCIFSSFAVCVNNIWFPYGSGIFFHLKPPLMPLSLINSKWKQHCKNTSIIFQEPWERERCSAINLCHSSCMDFYFIPVILCEGGRLCSKHRCQSSLVPSLHEFLSPLHLRLSSLQLLQAFVSVAFAIICSYDLFVTCICRPASGIAQITEQNLEYMQCVCHYWSRLLLTAGRMCWTVPFPQQN